MPVAMCITHTAPRRWRSLPIGTDHATVLELHGSPMSHQKNDELKHAVLDALRYEPSVSASDIGVTADDGVVTLSGHVRTYVEKRAAEQAASRVKGVRGIAEKVEVRLPWDVKHDDEAIAAAALDHLRWNSSVPHDAVTVKVEKGWVTLHGTVEWHYQKDAAEDAVRGLHGVTAITNSIALKPQVNTADITTAIGHALHRSWFFEPNTIDVTATGGHVTLTGTAHSWQDRQMAESMAWGAAGATAVENDITVVRI